MPSNKYGSTTMGYSSHFQTPRVRSAYPVKKQAQPIRIRSAYPLKSPPQPNSALRKGARSGYANDRSLYRSRSPVKNDYMKILDDTARLSIQKDMSVTGGEIIPFNNKTASPSKSYTQLKRIKLQPSALPKFTENVPETAMLPPLSEARVRSKAKPKTNHVAPVTNLKSANGNFKTVNGDSSYSTAVVGRKPTSAQHRNMPPLSKPGQYRQMYNIPTTTFRSGNSRSDMEVSIELVGTSLSLFEPIARPPRPIPKLRMNFWKTRICITQVLSVPKDLLSVLVGFCLATVQVCPENPSSFTVIPLSWPSTIRLLPNFWTLLNTHASRFVLLYSVSMNISLIYLQVNSLTFIVRRKKDF